MKAAEMEIVTWVSINGDKKLCDLVYNDWQLTKEFNFGSIYLDEMPRKYSKLDSILAK